MAHSVYGPTNVPGSCLWCGRKLRWVTDFTKEPTDKMPAHCAGSTYQPYPCKLPLTQDGRGWKCAEGHYTRAVTRVTERKRRYDQPGPRGNGFFCTGRCGEKFGWAAARNGYRFAPK